MNRKEQLVIARAANKMTGVRDCLQCGVPFDGPGQKKYCRRACARVTQPHMLNRTKRPSGECALCSSTHKLTTDHIIPRQAGGTDDPKNLRVLCQLCNIAEYYRLRDEAMQFYFTHPDGYAKQKRHLLRNQLE